MATRPDTRSEQSRSGAQRGVRGTQAALKQAYRILFREGLAIPNALERIESELPPLPEIRHLVQFIRTSDRGIGKS